MATKAEKAEAPDITPTEASAKKSVTSNGVLSTTGTPLKGKVIIGRKTKLSAKEQGQLARGEIDEAGDPTGKPIQLGKGKRGVTVAEPEETLYQGKFTLHARAAATGEPVSVVCEQVEPCTEDGLFYHFLQYHPSAIRSTFKIDADNRTDPTLRTHLE